MIELQCLGAAGTVTGSKHLVTTPRARVLVDCGLFQGERELKALNREPLPFAPHDLDALVLTHAHLDHTGYVPKLVREGYTGPVYATPATADLLGLLWPDAGFLQEEEAQHARRKRWSRHENPEPLFTVLDAQRALRRLRELAFDKVMAIAPGITLRYRRAGHILGAATVELVVEAEGHVETIVFSGDLGRSRSPMLAPPVPVHRADVLLLESTYGARLHPDRDPRDCLGEVVREAVDRGGMLVIPAFAVGRTQELLLLLRQLEDAKEIPSLEVFVDSPMAVDATEIAREHTADLGPQALALLGQGMAPRRTHLIRDAAGSRALNVIHGPGIILSASGMATGGRIKHHLRHRLPDPRATVCLAGFQAAGTRGRQLEEGAHEVWIFGERVPVRATIARVEGLSAHADREELLAWLAHFEAPPRQTLLVHGEPDASQALAQAIRARLGWNVAIPTMGEVIALVPGAPSKAVTP